MTKDKQLTFLIEEEKRDRLKQHCADLGLTISQVLTNYVDDLLSGSVSAQTFTSTYNIDISQAVDESIDRLKPELLEIVLHPINSIEVKVKQNTDDIHQLENALYTCQTMLRTLSELVNKKNISKVEVEVDPQIKQTIAHTLKPEQPIKNQSGQEVDLSNQPYTLDDTRIYLQGKGDYNRTRNKMSDRISQEDIAIHLSAYNYPHPQNRKWTRDEVRKVCKMWSIATR